MNQVELFPDKSPDFHRSKAINWQKTRGMAMESKWRSLALKNGTESGSINRTIWPTKESARRCVLLGDARHDIWRPEIDGQRSVSRPSRVHFSTNGRHYSIDACNNKAIRNRSSLPPHWSPVDQSQTAKIDKRKFSRIYWIYW